jgi:hypothetical protein
MTCVLERRVLEMMGAYDRETSMEWFSALNVARDNKMTW